MRCLVDTHLLVWLAREPARLSAETVGILSDEGNELYFSVVSLWELVITASLPRRGFEFDSRELRRGLLESGYTELAVGAEHVLEVPRLNELHRDPFDRLLLAQARVEGLVLLTGDARLLDYGFPTQSA